MHRKNLLRLLLAALLVAAGLLSVPTAMAADLTKTLTASSSLGEYPSGNAADGNANTYWESGNNAFPQWLQADLGATKRRQPGDARTPVLLGCAQPDHHGPGQHQRLRVQHARRQYGVQLQRHATPSRSPSPTPRRAMSG